MWWIGCLTYPSPFFRFGSSETTAAFQLFLVQCHVVVLLHSGLERSALGHLLSHGVLMSDRGGPEAHQRFLIPTLQVDHLLDFSQRRQRPQNRP